MRRAGGQQLEPVHRLQRHEPVPDGLLLVDGGVQGRRGGGVRLDVPELSFEYERADPSAKRTVGMTHVGFMARRGVLELESPFKF